ncbi:hypothetical protein [Maribacter sp. ACAM166]|uniref:hypothetical protein n=1 Tax=Maribacter sp. ACAM166 TaxID=2508996 RepID=UPI0010FE2627|nr:hypothetical protein [Maribacter sp. ACAM166]TLP71891.1 hypothetical protein ES765_19065 [Maribacter sp. ACAM166]
MKFANIVISLLYVSITLASSFKIAGTLGYYALFTEDFVERFCENKTMPELQCNGKCTLSKMLLQESKEEKKPINIDWVKNETVFFIDQIVVIAFEEITLDYSDNYNYSNLYNYSFLSPTLHPPRL